MYVRADWMKTLGKTMPTTTDELYDVLKAFTTGDPDKNGNADTFGTSGWLWAIHFIPWVNIYGWKEENGKWIPGYVSDDFLPALQFFNKLYKEKILDPEFAIAKSNDMFYQGKMGLMYSNAGEYWLWTHIQAKFGGAHPEIEDPFEAVQLIPPLKKDAASKQVWLGTFNGQCSLFGANCTDEKLERLLEFYEWSLTPEGRDFGAYGFKDKDYVIQNGKAAITLPMNETQYGKMKFLWEV
jgi:putative aldouronate transport system substrate-binding protein